MNCEKDVLEAQQRLLPRSLEWLVTPVEAMLSARESHAAQRVREVSEYQADRFGRLYQFSLSQEISLSFGPPLFTGESLNQSPAEMAKGEWQAATQDDEEGKSARVRAYKPLLDSWLKAAETEEASVRCSHRLEPRSPPLGWTLNDADRLLLDCLAHQRAHRITRRAPPMAPSPQ